MSTETNRAAHRQRRPAADPPLAVGIAALGAAFLALRAVTTLAAGANFASPGDGWRSIWQLVIVAVLVGGLIRRSLLPAALAVVATVYLAATLSELVAPDVLIGAIPVDMRDRIVHPLVALLATGALVLVVVARRRPASGRVQRAA